MLSQVSLRNKDLFKIFINDHSVSGFVCAIVKVWERAILFYLMLKFILYVLHHYYLLTVVKKKTFKKNYVSMTEQNKQWNI